jgi:hypothetical protein
MQIAVTPGKPFQREVIREGPSSSGRRSIGIGISVSASAFCIGIGMSGSVATSPTLPATGGWVEMSATRGIDLVDCLWIPPNGELIIRLYL